MDIKLLIFNGDDMIRLIPMGGLLGGSLVPRGASHAVGDAPPYFVKVYAPFEYELGTFLVEGGIYSFRPTVPPFLLAPSTAPMFTNSTQTAIVVCICNADDWTRTVWFPFTWFFARLTKPARTVLPGEGFVLKGDPCVVRIFGGGGMERWHEKSYCMANANEHVEYLGSIQWTSQRVGFRNARLHL